MNGNYFANNEAARLVRGRAYHPECLPDAAEGTCIADEEVSIDLRGELDGACAYCYEPLYKSEEEG